MEIGNREYEVGLISIFSLFVEGRQKAEGRRQKAEGKE